MKYNLVTGGERLPLAARWLRLALLAYVREWQRRSGQKSADHGLEPSAGTFTGLTTATV
jgi:hypothetical protein